LRRRRTGFTRALATAEVVAGATQVLELEVHRTREVRIAFRDELGRALLGRYADMLNDEEYDALGDIEQPAPPEDAT
jgi:hypothetical protein